MCLGVLNCEGGMRRDNGRVHLSKCGLSQDLSDNIYQYIVSVRNLLPGLIYWPNIEFLSFLFVGDGMLCQYYCVASRSGGERWRLGA